MVVETGGATKIIRANLPKGYGLLESPNKGSLAFETGLKIMRATEKTPSKFVQKQFITETKTLSPRQVREVLNFAKKQEAMVYGSFPSRTQMPKELGRTPADIDIQLKVGADESAKLAQQLTKTLTGKGYPVRVSPETPTLIEANIEGVYHHAVDIHSIDQALTEASPSIGTTKVYGLSLGQKPIKIEGIETMRLSEQGIRKGGSIFTLRETGFAPASHRIKDIPDFFAVQETLIRSKLFGKKNLMGELAKLKSMYPQDIFKTKTEVKLPLYLPKTKIKTPYPSVWVISPSVQSSRSTPIKVSPNIALSEYPTSFRSISPSLSKSLYKSISTYKISPSPYKITSISPSKSVSRSKSVSVLSSPSISPKRSISPSRSPSISSSPLLNFPRTQTRILPLFEENKKIKRYVKIIKIKPPSSTFTPTLIGETFMPKIKATAALGKMQFAGGLSIRPQIKIPIPKMKILKPMKVMAI